MYFEMSAEGGSNKEWKAIFIEDKNHPIDLVNSLSNRKELYREEPIGMFLINIFKNITDRKILPYEADFVYWTDDITYQAYRPSGVTAIIISEKLKSILNGFSMPAHKYYQVNLKVYENPSQYKLYYLLQFFDSITEVTDFKRSEFTYVNRKTREIIKTEYGSFSKEEYPSKSSELLRQGIRIDISTRAVTVNHDVLWGFGSSLLINQKVKEAIETIDVKGISIKPFDEFKIQPN